MATPLQHGRAILSHPGGHTRITSASRARGAFPLEAAAMRRLRSWYDRNRAPELKIQHRFRTEHKLFAFACGGNTRACACAHGSSDGGTLGATKKSAQDGAQGCSSTHLFSRALAAGLAPSRVLAGLQVVLPPVDGKFNCSASAELPANRPALLASTIFPVSSYPAGTTVAPDASVRAVSRVARKLSPGWLLPESTSSSSRTVMLVPSGMVIGLGCGGGTGAAVLGAGVVPA